MRGADRRGAASAAASGSLLLAGLVGAAVPLPAQAGPAAFEPGACPTTTGTIPTLVIAGSYDAITSAESAAAAAKPLTKATLIVIPGVGHFVVPKSPCAQQVMASFLANPSAPDTACVATLKPPPFTIAPQ